MISSGLLCTVPFARAGEGCLVRSGLVQLLDQLCSLAAPSSSAQPNVSNAASAANPSSSVTQRVSALAWAGFQVGNTVVKFLL